jgi:hypothetical protein
MYTEKELLQLAGKLAIASQNVVDSHVKTVSYYIKELEKVLDDYNNAIISNMNK